MRAVLVLGWLRAERRTELGEQVPAAKERIHRCRDPLKPFELTRRKTKKMKRKNSMKRFQFHRFSSAPDP